MTRARARGSYRPGALAADDARVIGLQAAVASMAGHL